MGLFAFPAFKRRQSRADLPRQLSNLLDKLLPAAKGLIIELTPTASHLFTGLLASRLQQPQDLIAVAGSHASAGRLARLHPKIEVLSASFNGEPPALRRIIDIAPFTARAIVSRLKLPRDMAYQYRLLQSGFQLLALDGQLIHIQQGSGAPFDDRVLGRLRLKATESGSFQPGSGTYTVWQVTRA
jgi:hypothetical protein